LTIKFTRHIQESSQPSAISIQPKTIPNTPLKLYGPRSCSSHASPPSAIGSQLSVFSLTAEC
jgi:hypothetical protein